MTGKTLVTMHGTRWLINGRATCSGSPAEGLLPNVRMVNSVFEDRGPAAVNLPAGFDPRKNTRAFVAAIPRYVASGVRAFTLSLQGGAPGYEGAINSAYGPDGSLLDGYMARVLAAVQACDVAGAVVILSCFYQRQRQALTGRTSLLAAVRNTAAWVRDHGLTNVVLEISNELAHGGYRGWRDGDWLTSAQGQVELIELARKTAPSLLVSTSGMGDGMADATITRACDFLLIHLNNTALADYPDRITQAKTWGKPVICNEDDKIGPAGAAAARVCVAGGASWGFMHSRKNQNIPFEFDGPSDDPDVYAELARLTRPGENLDHDQAAPDLGALRQIVITYPTDGARLPRGQRVIVEVGVTAQPRQIELLANNFLVACTAGPVWRLAWEPTLEGIFDLTCRAAWPDGATTLSRPVDVVVGG
ncbi:MAG: hypothetical protein IT442_13025 [Phycisphaeraceae bacterium]|nr:hypothetical protein [Phycisphaeraceae bacterium]